MTYLRDVTERRRIEEKLERKNAELEGYMHNISHDLRSPLVSLLGFGRLLREDYGELLGEAGGHFLDRIEQAGRTMEALISDLAELSRTIFATEITLPDRSLFEQVEQLERRLIVEALLAACGNRSEAARMLGVHEATVRTKLKRYGISLEGGVPN